MFANNGYPSVADIAAAFPNRGNGDGNGWGGDGGWWVIVLLMAMWGGFGGNGWGTNRNANAEFTDAALQRGFDTQTIINKLDGINSGLCSLGYDQLAQMNGINTNILQTGFGIQQAINSDTVANMQNTNALSQQLASCCCDNRAAIKDLQYAISQNDCAIKTQIHETGDAIIQNNNWNFRDLNDSIRNGFAEMQRQNDMRYIAELERKVNTAERQSELSNLYNNLTAYLAPPARPAYLACNPATGSIWPQGNCGGWPFNNGCGCNSCCGNSCCG